MCMLLLLGVWKCLILFGLGMKVFGFLVLIWYFSVWLWMIMFFWWIESFLLEVMCSIFLMMLILVIILDIGCFICM